MLKFNRRWLALAGLLVAGAAYSSPWDIDMIDSRAFRAYEWKMRTMLPDGVLQRVETGPKGVGGYQTDYIAPMDRNASDGLVNPYPVDEASLATGKRLMQTTCAPCHGVDGTGGGPVTHNDPAKGINRFPVPAPMLSGEGAVSAVRSDGYMYGTIRYGGNLMPAYGISLTDQERWAIVSYIRTLEGGAFVPPTPAVESGAVAPAATAPAATGGTSG